MASAFVASTIKAEKVVVFSKTYCPYCVKARRLHSGGGSGAKRALSQFTQNFSVVELDQRGDGDAIQDALLELTGGRR
ncbi:hypothetical protein MNEG_4810 [Monoraphidium neglectum]|uniref:Uncharacterized protein n=1 Tax=Monoraphidium neglectum TaxID=145388 RepID=A0A0D2NCW5_9CHLO|nr:hypothetical protein MNEG_4810 [Monoraphidium neglectum]KIZ03146.1 hypothetical protein MNEG_4810 [Monoraphidium neglectum]|eukprot:XP_013902165.1 hypothetical protein MNEG_4810 [Monoraphidium neglectum]